MSKSSAVISPLSGTHEVDLVREYDSSDIIQKWKDKYGFDITDELGGAKTIQLYRCRSSQLEFFYPSSLTGSGKLYEQLAEKSEYYKEWRWEHETASKLVQEGDRLLEIGCGAGSFLKAAEKAGAKATGLEFNTDALKAARDAGLTVENYDVATARDKFETPFSFVCAFQVLEHVEDPLAFLKMTVDLLEEDGTLILCVPDGGGWVGRNFNLLDMPPHHMSRWNGAAFQYLTRILPLEMTSLQIEPLQDYHTRSFLNASLLPNDGTKHLNKFQLRVLKNIAKWSSRMLSNWNVSSVLPGQCLYASFRKKKSS